MKLRTTFFASVLSVMVLTCEAASFGAVVDKSSAVDVSVLLASPEQYLGKQITVQGTVEAVCEKMGCWMQLRVAGDEPAFRIKVKDGDMVFPLSAKGKVAYAMGSLKPLPMDLEATRDYFAEKAEKEGKAFDESSVTQAITQYQLVPTAVEIAD